MTDINPRVTCIKCTRLAGPFLKDRNAYYGCTLHHDDPNVCNLFGEAEVFQEGQCGYFQDKSEPSAPQWTTETPTEVGCYWLSQKYRRIIPVLIRKINNELCVTDTLPNLEIYWHTLSDFCKFRKLQWLKVPPPPLPEESEVNQ